jgi:hypothetical protein
MSVEERVRAALAIRADLITADRLQPARPPTGSTARPVRRWMPMLAAAAAAVAILFTVILLIRPGADMPASPATPSPVSSVPPAVQTAPPVPPPNGKVPRPGATPVSHGPGAPAPGHSPAGAAVPPAVR